MKLSKALGEKNRLARRIKEIQNRIVAHNSYIKGNTPVYSVSQLLEEMNSTIIELTDLKTRIFNANKPVQDKIFRLAELKSVATFLRKLKIKEGKVVEERWNAEVREWESELGALGRDKLLDEIESEIDSIQIELDKFNFETEI
ncbi:MAG: hypothetical protein R2792_03645 [Saprospiraceae bacterium]